MNIPTIQLKVKVDPGPPIVIEAPPSLEEAILRVRCDIASKPEKISLQLDARRPKLLDSKAYVQLIRKAGKSGETEIELKALIQDQSERALEETEVTSDLRSNSVMAVDPVFTVLYKRINGPPKEYTPLHFYSINYLLIDLSNMILNHEGINSDWVCALYTEQGMPLAGTLEQMYLVKCMKVLNDREKIHAFIVPAMPVLPDLDPYEGQDTLVLKNEHNYNEIFEVKVNLQENTVEELKRKLSPLVKIMIMQLSIRKGDDTILSQNEKTLSEYELENGCLLFYQKKEVNYMTGSYKTQYTQSIPQNVEGLRKLHSFLFSFSKTSNVLNRRSFLAVARLTSKNCAPLVNALKELINNHSINFLESIALEEGFLILIQNVLDELFPSNTIAKESLFEHSIEVCALLCQLSTLNFEVVAQENYKLIDTVDPLNAHRVKQPVLLTNDQGNTFVYDYKVLAEKISENVAIPGISNLKMQDLVIDEEYKLNIKRCVKNNKTSMSVWTGKYFPMPLSQLIYSKFPCKLEWNDFSLLPSKHKLTTMTNPLLLKHFSNKNLMTLDKNRGIRINRGITPCTVNDVQLLDILTGDILNIDINELGRMLHATLPKEEETKEVISRPPNEAIVVVFDTSTSMNMPFVNDSGFSRIAATTQFFENYSDRTIGYAYNHAVALILFNHQVNHVCNFTENFSIFTNKIHSVFPNGGTALYDAIAEAIVKLQSFLEKYNNCKGRILCLSDGFDEHSAKTALQVSRLLSQHKVVLDCVVVGRESSELKAMALASGGCAILPESLSHGIKLFESEALLSLNCRETSVPVSIRYRSDMAVFLETTISSTAPVMKNPAQLGSKKELPDAVLQRAAVNPIQFTNQNSALRYKRIMRELKIMNDNPHPNISILPSADDIDFWNVYIEGPNGTPYVGGIFHLFIQFGENYPQSPPEVRFLTQIYHCNINSTGRVCHSILDQFYRVDLGVRQIFDCIFGLLMAPEVLDPLDASRASEYLHNRTQYEAKAIEYTKKYAAQSISEIKQGAIKPENLPYFNDPVTGELMDDPVICVKNNRTYERRNIEQCIRENGTDPIDGTPITLQDLIPNLPLKQAISDHISRMNNPWYLS